MPKVPVGFSRNLASGKYEKGREGDKLLDVMKDHADENKTKLEKIIELVTKMLKHQEDGGAGSGMDEHGPKIVEGLNKVHDKLHETNTKTESFKRGVYEAAKAITALNFRDLEGIFRKKEPVQQVKITNWNDSKIGEAEKNAVVPILGPLWSMTKVLLGLNKPKEKPKLEVKDVDRVAHATEALATEMHEGFKPLEQVRGIFSKMLTGAMQGATVGGATGGLLGGPAGVLHGAAIGGTAGGIRGLFRGYRDRNKHLHVPSHTLRGDKAPSQDNRGIFKKLLGKAAFGTPLRTQHTSHHGATTFLSHLPPIHEILKQIHQDLTTRRAAEEGGAAGAGAALKPKPPQGIPFGIPIAQMVPTGIPMGIPIAQHAPAEEKQEQAEPEKPVHKMAQYLALTKEQQEEYKKLGQSLAEAEVELQNFGDTLAKVIRDKLEANIAEIESKMQELLGGKAETATEPVEREDTIKPVFGRGRGRRKAVGDADDDETTKFPHKHGGFGLKDKLFSGILSGGILASLFAGGGSAGASGGGVATASVGGGLLGGLGGAGGGGLGGLVSGISSIGGIMTNLGGLGTAIASTTASLIAMVAESSVLLPILVGLAAALAPLVPLIIAAVAGIGALVAVLAVFAVVTKLGIDALESLSQGAVKTLKDGMQGAIDGFGKLAHGDFFGAINTAGVTVVKVFEDVSDAVTGCIPILGGVLSNVLHLFTGALESCIQVATGFAQNMLPLVQQISPATVENFNYQMKGLQATLGIAFTGFVATMADTIKSIAGAFLPLAEEFKPMFTELGGIVRMFLIPAFKVLTSLIGAILSPLRDSMGSLRNIVIEVVKSFTILAAMVARLFGATDFIDRLRNSLARPETAAGATPAGPASMTSFEQISKDIAVAAAQASAGAGAEADSHRTPSDIMEEILSTIDDISTEGFEELISRFITYFNEFWERVKGYAREIGSNVQTYVERQIGPWISIVLDRVLAWLRANFPGLMATPQAINEVVSGYMANPTSYLQDVWNFYTNW